MLRVFGMLFGVGLLFTKFVFIESILLNWIKVILLEIEWKMKLNVGDIIRWEDLLGINDSHSFFSGVILVNEEEIWFSCWYEKYKYYYKSYNLGVITTT